MVAGIRKKPKIICSSSCSLKQRGIPAGERDACDLPYEISTSTNWSTALGPSPENLAARRIGKHEIWLVEGLLSNDECMSLINRSERIGYGPTDFAKSYRGNLRLTTTDSGLAKSVWKRLQPLLPAVLSLKAPRPLVDESWWAHYPNVDGKWEAIGLNECWRLAKYHPGDQFMCHCDGAFERHASLEMSMLSATIYLNDGYCGGKTRFYLSDDPYFECRADFGEPDFEIVPKTGMCLLFRQPPGCTYWHDGQALASGQKYLLRSDVMYRKRSNSFHPKLR